MADFKEWLISKKSLGISSAGDVASRLKRVNSFCSIENYSTPHKLIYELTLNSEFNGLSVSVRSQLKRSVNLYFEFLQSK